jgi:hypothetical protein
MNGLKQNSMESLREKIERYSKQTVGYSEAENKESFMVGVSVAISFTQELYLSEIKDLKTQLEGFRGANETYLNDLKTMSSIIIRYSDDDF